MTVNLFLRIDDLAGRANAWLDRHALAAFGLVGLVIAAMTLSMAASKPLWHDEIYTVLLARLGAADLWTATRSGVDLSPPLNTWLTHVAVSAAGAGRVPTRLPPAVGFWLAVAFAFEFVRRRSNTTMALAAALLLCFTAGYRYSYEARGYGLMMGFAALSLFAWSEAAAGRRRGLYIPVLALALAAGYWNQYYGLFAAAPLIAGEIVRAIRDRRIDVAVWAALGLSFLTLVPLVPLMRAAASLAPTFWRKAALSDVFPTYAFLFDSLLYPPFLWAGLIALLLGAIARGLRLSHVSPRALPRPELAALVFYVALPAIQIVAAVSTTGVFVPRYALLAVPGVCIAIALAAVRVTHASDVAQIVIAATLAGAFAATVTIPPSFTNPARQRPALMQLLAQGHRVAVSGGLMYLQLWYYTPPEMRERLYYLADPGAALTYTGSDTIDQGLIGLAKWSRINVVERPSFTEANPEFRIYASGSGWLVAWLRDHNAPVEQIGVELGAPILVVGTLVIRQADHPR